MTVVEAQKYGENMLRKAGIQSLRIDASLLLAKAAGKPRTWLFAHPEEELADKVSKSYIELINRRAERIPLVHLTNEVEFYGLKLFIDERVLTPRMETEKMVELAIQKSPPAGRIADVGTGSGAVAIALKKHRPDLEVFGSDVSRAALDVVKRNASTHQVSITLSAGNLLEPLDSKFDVILCNLPYLREDAELMPEVKYEPRVALLGGKDGLDLYRKLAEQLSTKLKKDGLLLTECDPWQQERLIEILQPAGLSPVENNYFITLFKRA